MRREAQEALRGSLRNRPPEKAAAPPPRPRFIRFGSMLSSVAAHVWQAAAAAARPPELCAACILVGSANTAPAPGRFPKCSRHPACVFNFQPFGRSFMRSSFLVRSHVLLYEPAELPADLPEPAAPEPMLIINPPAPSSRISKFSLAALKARRLEGPVPAGLLPKRLTKSLTDGQSSFFGGAGCVT